MPMPSNEITELHSRIVRISIKVMTLQVLISAPLFVPTPLKFCDRNVNPSFDMNIRNSIASNPLTTGTKFINLDTISCSGVFVNASITEEN